MEQRLMATLREQESKCISQETKCIDMNRS